VIHRLVNGNVQIVAAGSYIAHDPTTAEIALAVADRLQGKGIGTLLLECLAMLAVVV
jgi:acetate---CoA ligase (ADP-forming)